jgi:hypothetical protein
VYNRKRLEGTYNFNHPALAAAANCIYHCDRSLLKDAVNVITCLMKFHRELGDGEIYVRSDFRPFWWHGTRVTIMAEFEIRRQLPQVLYKSVCLPVTFEFPPMVLLELKLWSFQRVIVYHQLTMQKKLTGEVSWKYANCFIRDTSPSTTH